MAIGLQPGQHLPFADLNSEACECKAQLNCIHHPMFRLMNVIRLGYAFIFIKLQWQAKHDIYCTKLDESSKYHNISDDQTEDKEYDGLGDVDLTEEGERNVGLESLEDTQRSTSY